MTSTRHVFGRMIAYGLLLGVLNAVGGRLLHAALDPSIVLSLGATAWATYALAEARQRAAFLAGIVLWLGFIAGFVGCAYLLIGWNGSLPWRPRSTMWMVAFAVAVPVVALLAQFLGVRAAARATRTRTDDMSPNA